MKLTMGSVGEEVRQIQEFLNLLPGTKLAPLVIDGRFGPRTKSRVQEFQRSKRLADDGIVGALTMGAIQDLLRQLGLLPGPPSPASQVVRPINKEILGLDGVNNLIPQIIPSVRLISVPTFRAGVATNQPEFTSSGPTIGRLGIFAAKKNNIERAVILLLPATGTPDRILICITQVFEQGDNRKKLDPLGFAKPLAPELIKFCLLKHIINRWGAQMLASKKQMAFVYIVRSQAGAAVGELGPFANDGPFVKQTLNEMVSLTKGAFSFARTEAMTFSSGIKQFNTFLNSLSGHLNVETVYNLDPNPALGAAAPKDAVRKQFLSGSTGGPRAGFEFMGLDRWRNEDFFSQRQFLPDRSDFFYLHNHCIPLYALHLGIQTS